MTRFGIGTYIIGLALALSGCGEMDYAESEGEPERIENPELCADSEEDGQPVLECLPEAFASDRADEVVVVSDDVSSSSHALSYVPCRTKTRDAANACWCLYSARYAPGGRVCAYQECPC